MSKVSRNFKSHLILSDMAHDLRKTPRVIVSSEPREFSCQFSFSSFLSFSEKDSFLISVTHRPLFLILSAWRNWACNRVIPPNFQITKVEKSEWVIRKCDVVRFRVPFRVWLFTYQLVCGICLSSRKTSCICRYSAHFFATLAKCHGTRKMKKSAETKRESGCRPHFRNVAFWVSFF